MFPCFKKNLRGKFLKCFFCRHALRINLFLAFFSRESSMEVWKLHLINCFSVWRNILLHDLRVQSPFGIGQNNSLVQQVNTICINDDHQLSSIITCYFSMFFFDCLLGFIFLIVVSFIQWKIPTPFSFVNLFAHCDDIFWRSNICIKLFYKQNR